jgi:hypothetical protein
MTRSARSKVTERKDTKIELLVPSIQENLPRFEDLDSDQQMEKIRQLEQIIADMIADRIRTRTRVQWQGSNVN